MGRQGKSSGTRPADRTRRLTRPYTRARKTETPVGAELLSGAAQIAEASGWAERPTVEQLERRQMLFSLTVTADDVDPATGLGTVRAYFSYFIPILVNPNRPTQFNADDLRTEDFNDENPGPVGSNIFFGDSGIRIRHNIAVPNNIQIDPPDVDQQARYLRTDLNGIGDFVEFTFFEDIDNPTTRAAARTASFTTAAEPFSGSPVALDTDNVRVSLIFNNQVLATFTGAALRALIQPQGPLTSERGIGTFQFNAPAGTTGFDTIRIEAISQNGAAPLPAFRLDDITYTLPPGNWAPTADARRAGGVAVLTGPVGASVNFRDLYGREMIAGTNVGTPDGGRVALGDLDDNGVPEFNDGLGRITFTGVDSRTAFTLMGTTLETFQDEPPEGADFIAGGTAWFHLEGIVGLFDDFQGAGWGYTWDQPPGAQQPISSAPPNASGSTIIGSPFVRPNTSPAAYNPGGPAGPNILTTGFQRSEQGIFVENGQSIGSIIIHGAVHGSSRINGFIDRFAVGDMHGSLTVGGDLGSFIVAADAGVWAADPDFNPTFPIDPVLKSGAQLVVGRTVGEISIGGRSLMDITVAGDLTSPTTRPARSSFDYFEKEFIYGINPDNDASAVVDAFLNNNAAWVAGSTSVFRAGAQSIPFATSYYRNDSILTAEWIGSASTGVRIRGELSGRDPVQGEDAGDVYAFAADGTREIVIVSSGTRPVYMRVVDQEGRTLAAPQGPVFEGDVTRFTTAELKFRPDGPGVYYIVVSDPQGQEDNEGTEPYTLVVTGMAPTTLGTYRTGAGSGYTDQQLTLTNSVSVLTGSIGAIRIGTGVSGPDGTEVVSTDAINTDESDDDVMSWRGGTFSTPGTIYNITTGSDIGARGGQTNFVNVFAGGDVGTVFVGMSQLVAGNPNEGDVVFFNLNVGGRLGFVDIRGGVGMDQDDENDPRAPLGVNVVNIRTGQNGGPGDIGFIRTGFHVAGDSMTVNTSPGSVVGALLVSQDDYVIENTPDDPTDDPTDPAGQPRYGIYRGNGAGNGLRINTGAGSDVRFVDLPRIDLLNSRNVVYRLFEGQDLELFDDAGSRVKIKVSSDGSGRLVGVVRAMPIDGSQGVAIGQIIVDLSASGSLRIESSNTGTGGVVSIGRIIVTDGDNTSNISIDGVETDVYLIQQTGGTALQQIENRTINGDIVAIDVQGLDTLRLKGDLGRTQVPAWGMQNIAPYINLVAGGGGGGGTPGQIQITLPAGGGQGGRQTFDDDFTAGVFRPVTNDNFTAGQAFLDDVGSPIDFRLNGLVVRTGSVQSVQVDGAVGDVILEAADSVLQSLEIDRDRTAPFGVFHGLFGNVFANDIVTVDVGMGMAPLNDSPFATTSIVALDDIDLVKSSRNAGVVISGVINAFNNTPSDPLNPVEPPEADGLNRVEITNGRVIDAVIGSMKFDYFWRGFTQTYRNDDDAFGNITRINLQNTDLFRSIIFGRNLETLEIQGGFYDATQTRILGNARDISAAGFRNSTLNGSETEIRVNIITVAGDLDELIAPNGDIADLTVDVVGSVKDGIVARNIIRSSINVDNEIKQVTAGLDIRASEFVAGSIPRIQAGRNIVSSAITASGALQQLTAAGVISNTSVSVTGPSGRIDSVTAQSISGAISASGPIGVVNATAGDIRATVTTTTANGNVQTLSASGNLAITTDLSGNLSSMIAGGNIGSAATPGVILVRGNLQSASAANGQLFSDIRVGGTVNQVTLGGAVNKPGNVQIGGGSIVAFGRINTVTVGGDFGGGILSYSGGIGAVTINNGSFLSGKAIEARDGSIDSVTINNGNLYGDVLADQNITALRVNAAADGVFGDIGVNPAQSQGVFYDARRNRLPAGVGPSVAVQGPTIRAGNSIVNVTVSGGSVFETSFYAGTTIQSITVNGSVGGDGLTTGTSSFFAAGDAITNVSITGSLADAVFVAGVTSLGADNRPGGIGANADTVKAGTITLVTVNGATSNVGFSAGIAAGADGVYNTSDDRVALGTGSIQTLTLRGSVTNVSAFGDVLSSSVLNDSRLNRGGTNLPSVNGDLDNGVGTPGVSFTGTRSFGFGGGTVTISLTGGGTAFFDAGLGRLTLRNTGANSVVTVGHSGGAMSNFDIVSNDDASLRSLTVTAALSGDSDIVIDGGIQTLNLAAFSGTGSIATGGDISTATFASFEGGFLSAANIGQLRVNGNYGNTNPAVTNEARIDAVSIGSLVVTGTTRGLVNVDRDVQSVQLSGGAQRANLRFGGSLNSFSSGVFSQSVLSVNNALGGVTITGDMFDSAILAGTDLGSDAFFGGTGAAADRLTTGTIGNVTVQGNFRESDIVAGYTRGGDGFFGTSDDLVAGGRGSIGNVTITGTQVGSARLGESYRIASSGTIGTVRVGGTIFQGTSGNFAVERANLSPDAIRVVDIRTSSAGRQFVANIVFNQPIDSSSLATALAVREVRGLGDVEITLINGVDYTVSYNASSNTAVVTFATSVTSANLPQVPGEPGPGIYRFGLNQNLLRGRLAGAPLDGNGDGVATAGDNFSEDTIVGDAGDKITAERVNANPAGNPYFVDFYAPINLDIVLDSNTATDGVADVNRTFTVRGSIGDHPDNDTDFFRFAGDSDVYSITLQAGQILRLGAMQGSAQLAQLRVFDASGNQIVAFQDTASGQSLPDVIDEELLTNPTSFLIRQTGTYFVVVANDEPGQGPSFLQQGVVPNLNAVAGGVGDYNFTITIFDDGDTGFTSNTNSGDGANVVDAPAPISFAGADGIFGTGDDQSVIPIGAYNFTLNVGPDGLPNTADDVVSGTNNAGIVSVRQNGVLTSTITASIGPSGASGVPGSLAADVDIFHLNNRQPILPGTSMRISIRLTGTGSDLGSPAATLQGVINSDRGSVQFGLFDTSNSTSVDDAVLVFSPTDFSPNGGPPNTLIASNGSTRYGYDANGDFYIEFLVPERLGAPGLPGTFAVYVQGLFNSDYAVEVVQNGVSTLPQRQGQNILIETGGGLVDWLQRGGVVTTLSPFDVATLGFTGTIAGQPAASYILNQTIAQLNALFQGATGFDVRFALSSTDFEFEPFSTVYLTDSPDPLTPIFNQFSGFNFANIIQQLGGGDAFFSTQPYGYSEHSDPLNADQEDEAVVFVPPFALQGFTPSQTDADSFAQSLTAAIARRTGELLGLRIAADNTPGTGQFDPFASDSVNNRPGPGLSYSIPTADRALSTSFDAVNGTNFFLGRQNATSLLDQILGRI